jgi:LPS sulfotransferase NodH
MTHRPGGVDGLDASWIFSQLQVTLLAPLNALDGLVFVGPRETLEHLRAAFARSPGCPRHRYLFLSDDSDTWKRAIEGRQLVVASLRDEDASYAAVVGRVGEIGAHASVRRLFADVLPNAIAGTDLLQQLTEPFRPPTVRYTIVGTPRSGTEFLCRLLGSTGTAGQPKEHLQIESQVLTRYCGFDCRRYLRTLMSLATTHNGVFGTKIISHFFIEHVSADPTLERFLSRFKCIHIVRQDRIRQSISAMLAAKTNVWHISSDEEYAEYRGMLSRLAISEDDLRRVEEIAEGLEHHERYLARFFEQYGIVPLTIKYEELVEDPVVQLKRILAFLDLAVNIAGTAAAVPTRRMESPLSVALRARYSAAARPS